MFYFTARPQYKPENIIIVDPEIICEEAPSY